MYQALLGAVLFLLLCLGAMTYLWTMRNLYPGVAIVRVPTAEEAPGPPRRVGPTRRLLVVQPRENIACAERGAFDLWSETLHWQRLGEAMGMEVQYGGEGLIPARPTRLDAIVVPWVLCLGPDTRAALDRFAAAGGGLVVSGRSDLLGAEPEPFRAEASFVVPAGRTAPGAALAPGRRLELTPEGAKLTGAGGEPVLWWSQWLLKPSPEDAPRWAAAATLRQERGRRVWFGFPVSTTEPGSSVEMDRVRSLAVAWAAGDDVIGIAPWPEARRFAFVAAVDVQGRAGEIDRALAALDELALHPTVFVHADVDGVPGPTRRALAVLPEIGSRGDRRTRFEGGTRIHQRQKLEESRRRLDALSPEPVLGLRVPRERFDDLTLHESAAAGYRYVLGDPGFDRAYPRWVSAEGRRIALVSRAGAGDDHAYARQGRDGFERDLATLRDLGGLYVMALTTERLVDDARRAALAPALRLARQARPWEATAGEVVRWARGRRRVALEVSAGALEVRHQGGAELRDLTLEVFGREGTPRLERIPRLVPGQPVRVSLASEGTGSGAGWALAPSQGPTAIAGDPSP